MRVRINANVTYKPHISQLDEFLEIVHQVPHSGYLRGIQILSSSDYFNRESRLRVSTDACFDRRRNATHWDIEGFILSRVEYLFSKTGEAG